MSSGSLKKFLKLTKKNVKKLPLQSWKRWCTQILSALRCVGALCTASLPWANGTWVIVLGGESSTLTKRVELIDWSATFSDGIVYVYIYSLQNVL